jgi:hypothetical protein
VHDSSRQPTTATSRGIARSVAFDCDGMTDEEDPHLGVCGVVAMEPEGSIDHDLV